MALAVLVGVLIHGATLSPDLCAAAGGSEEHLIGRQKLVQRLLQHESISNVVLAQIQRRAYIPCYIKRLGKRSVSWIRKRDSYIISVDQAVFINDPRFLVHHTNFSDQWILQIKQVKMEDQGIYECQISGEPKTSYEIVLQVLVPLVDITPSGDFHVNQGGSAVMRCRISGCLEDPAYIRWLRNSVLINPRAAQGSRVRYESTRINESVVTSVLEVRDARKSDQGLYMCYPYGLPSANVTLHVLNGEKSAAMKREFGRSDCGPRSPSAATALAILLLAAGSSP